jgi:hypothetical protein
MAHIVSVARLGWSLSGANEVNNFFHRIRRQIDNGRRILFQLTKDGWQTFQIADLPTAEPYGEPGGAGSPRDDDPYVLVLPLQTRLTSSTRFYLATDGEELTHLDTLHEGGALLLVDLLTPDDRQILGPAAVLADYINLLEEAIMIRASFFAGHSLGSVSGAIANQRTRRGHDMRTIVLA